MSIFVCFFFSSFSQSSVRCERAAYAWSVYLSIYFLNEWISITVNRYTRNERTQFWIHICIFRALSGRSKLSGRTPYTNTTTTTIHQQQQQFSLLDHSDYLQIFLWLPLQFFFFFISIPITKSERGNLRVQKWKCPTSPPINYINIWNGDAIHFFFFFIIFRFVQKRVRASYSISSYSHRSACCMPNVRDEKKKTHSHPIRIRQLRCYRWVETSISFFFHYKLPVIMSLDDEPKRRLVVVWKLCSDDGHVTSKGY